MALLAEGKKKTKYGLDPQNTQWSNDSNKFGQRLMEKMGWEKGKGLGANENGMTEHIKASYKWDQTGLGASPQSADAWVAHQDDFNDLLKTLNSENQSEEPQKKDKPQTDGQKRYYGRFSRGRVQTLRTTEDLDCIFGRRKSASAPTTPSNQSRVNSGDEGSDEDEATENAEKSHGLTTVTSSTSVQDYFAKKMSEMKARRAKSAAMEESVDGVQNSSESTESLAVSPAVYGRMAFSYNDNEKEDSKGKDAESEEKPSRGWYQSWKLDQTKDNTVDVDEGKMSKKKKKKKKDKKVKCDSDVEDSKECENSGSKEEAGNVECVSVAAGEEAASPSNEERQTRSSKKKKKKRKHEPERNLDSGDERKTEVETGTSLTETDTIVPPSLSKKKENGSDEACASVASSAVIEETDRPSKKNKRKRTADKDSEDDKEQNKKSRKTCEDENGNEGLNSTSPDEVSKGHVKKLKKKAKKDQTDEGKNIDIDSGKGNDDNLHPKEAEEKLKKKKRKASKDDPGASDVAVADDSSEKTNCDEAKKKSPNVTKKKRKKSKRKKKPSMFPGSNLEEVDGYAQINVKPKVKKPPPPPKKTAAEKKKKKDRLLRASEIDDKLREVSKLQGGRVSKKI